MDEIDRKILSGLEEGIALTAEPFNEIALKLGVTPKEVIARLIQLRKSGEIRRFGVSIKPNTVGFSANALVAWKAPVDRIKEIGLRLSSFPEISHCYERKPVSGRWEYNLYTVMHAKEPESIKRMVNQISVEMALDEYEILYSKRDLKRTLLCLDDSVKAQSENLVGLEHF